MQLKVISLKDIACGLVDQNGAALEGVLPVYKEYGETPLECLKRLRKSQPELAQATLSYAGRLDPLAEGLMLMLVGKETNQNRQQYLRLDKEYEVEVLFGISTDTGDLLGIPIAQSHENNTTLNQSDLSQSQIEVALPEVLASLKGKQNFPYPAYSSRTVQGKPLFEWAKEGRLKEISIPVSEVFIEDINLLDTYILSAEDFFANTVKAIGLVSGDFRQEAIVAAWDELRIKKLSRPEGFIIAKIKVTCSSGTYMRTLAEEIGKRLKLLAFAYRIKRTAVAQVGLDQIGLDSALGNTSPDIL